MKQRNSRKNLKKTKKINNVSGKDFSYIVLSSRNCRGSIEVINDFATVPYYQQEIKDASDIL